MLTRPTSRAVGQTSAPRLSAGTASLWGVRGSTGSPAVTRPSSLPSRAQGNSRAQDVEPGAALASPQHRADDTFLYRLCGEWRMATGGGDGDVEETTEKVNGRSHMPSLQSVAGRVECREIPSVTITAVETKK